ncbi:sugar-binding protein [Paenibacillus roseipurpureus]|uniref:Probable pectate lyase C n=1 Tax=Paenibacillus roseopurpureus TaxID=2918901 RepID=A0AA96LRP1_9BACL|nr:sugar-binding protein [Paenibacillus sp. MBLB1832]WNR46017.1 sugar-binding protein [Paenibacillus sp. MBLB1832]
MLKRTSIWMLIMALILMATMAPILPASTVYAAGGTIYEAEAATKVDAPIQTVVGAVYSGAGYVDLGAKSNSASVTWTTVQAVTYGNYIVNIAYSNTDATPKPISLIVNGQKYTTFAGDKTGDGPLPTWSTLTAVVLLNQGNNTIKLASEGADGPLVDDFELTPFATIFEAENGAGAAHSNVSIAANVATAPGFSGTGYASIAAGITGYMLYNNVVLPETGKYTLKVRYSLGNSARPYAVTVNGVRVQDAKGVSTGTWANWTYEELTGLDFHAGVNTLKIERIGVNATPVIDRFELVSEKPFDVGDQTFRTTSFESSDVDPVIANTATDGVLNSPVIIGSALKSTSASTVKIVSTAGNRWAEVTVPAEKPGIIGFPFHSSWLPPVPMKSYTLESSFMLKDEKANYIFKLITAAGMESPIFAFGMDYNKIYARSNNSAAGALAARADWSVNTLYKVKLVFHLDTKSYDMYLNNTKIVNSEPLQNDAYLGGLKGFFLEVKDGARQETKILVDDVQLSGSNTAGTAPITNPSPGSIFVEQPYIGQPVVYYVSPSGLDTNNGLTTTTAFKTITKAVSVTNPGDTVNIMPGTYSPGNDANDFVLINRSGAKDVKTGVESYITYKAYDPANKPKLLLPPNIKGVWDMIDVSANYIIIDGLEIEGNNLNITLAQGEANYASKVAGGTDWSTYALTNTNGMTMHGHHIITRNNHVHHLSGGGITGSGDYITIENNDIHSNSWYTFYATSGISLINDVDFDNNTTDYKIFVRNNRVYDNETKVKWEQTKGYSDGNGIIFDVDDKYKGKKLVTNNIVYDNGGGGIHIYKSNNVHVINNTIYHNSRSPYLKYPNMDVNSGDNNIFLNNISIARDEAGEYANGSGGWNNLFANNIYGGLTRFLGKNERVIDPKFVSVTGVVYDFHLLPDSPAIDYGTRTLAPLIDYDGHLRPYAGAGSQNRVDIGAYETEYNNPAYLVDDTVTITEPTPEVAKAATAAKGTPVIDGQTDDLWSTTESFQALYVSDNTKPAPIATVRLLWDEHHLYVHAQVADTTLNASGGNLWEHDSMEFFVDENDAKTLSYQADDRHYRVNYLNLKSGGTNVTPDIFTSATSVVPGGYIIEAALPLTSITASVGTVIGFDAGASDDSNYDGIRDNATMWSNRRINSYASTQLFGNVTLVAPVTLTGITPVAVSTMVGTAPTLPSVVTAVYSNSSTSTVNVNWDAISPSRYATVGSFTVNGTVAGTDMKAVASVTVTAVPNVLPTVSLTGPVSESIRTAPANVELMATAVDSDGAINRVEFYDGSSLLGNGIAGAGNSYSLNWMNIPAGTHSIKAIAYDDMGGVGMSSTVTLIVNAAPTNAPLVETLTGPSSALAGSSFTTKYGMTHTVQSTVYAQDTIIYYDSNALQFVDAVSLKSGYNLVGKSTSTPGQLRLLATSTNSGVSTSGDLLDITWQAKQVNQTVTLSTYSIVLNNQNERLSTTAASLPVTVTNIPEDISGPLNGTKDGLVNLYDLLFVALNYGKSNASSDWPQASRGDVNQDGIIDIRDLLTIARKILQ